MQVGNDQLLSICNLENLPSCDECQELVRSFLEAAGECVNTLGRARTTGSRSDLLWTYNKMILHSDQCLKCNAV
jgi:hypothetical protein